MANGYLGNIYVMKRVEKIFEIGRHPEHGLYEVCEAEFEPSEKTKMGGLSTDDRAKNSDFRQIGLT